MVFKQHQGFGGWGGVIEVPEGTVAVIEARSDGVLKTIGVMIKRERGYDESSNNWYYEYRDGEGNIVVDEYGLAEPGRIGGCMGCHGAARHKDYLLGLMK